MIYNSQCERQYWKSFNWSQKNAYKVPVKSVFRNVEEVYHRDFCIFIVSTYRWIEGGFFFSNPGALPPNLKIFQKFFLEKIRKIFFFLEKIYFFSRNFFVFWKFFFSRKHFYSIFKFKNIFMKKTNSLQKINCFW